MGNIKFSNQVELCASRIDRLINISFIRLFKINR